MRAKINAMIKLKNGPAKTTLMRAHTDLLLNALSSPELSSSPSMIQAPPNGSSFMEYFVSPRCTPKRVGPSPRQNSLTFMPFALASQKCPSS